MYAVGLGNTVDLFASAIALLSGLLVLFCAGLRLRTRPVPAILLGGSLTALLFAAAFLVDRHVAAPLPDALLQLAPSLQLGLGDVLLTLACFAVAFTVNALLRRFVWLGSLGEGGQPRVPNILIAIVRLAVYAVALMAIFSLVFHRDVTAIAATSGVVAIVLGYSLQPTLSEVFAGLALNLSRAFRMGDSVQIDGVWGIIQEANWRSVSLRTYEGTLVVIPNTKMAGQRLTNMDMPTHNMRHHIRFTVDVNVPPGKVQEVALAAMNAQPNVLKSPPAMLLFKDLSEHGMIYEAIFWHFNPSVYILRRDEIGVALWYAFKRAGIPFSVLRHNLSAHADAVPAVPPVDPGHYRRQVRDRLAATPLFKCFDDAAIEQLVDHHRSRIYGPGEQVVRQNAEGSSMFIILEGQVSVLVEVDGAEQPVATLGPGEHFGHMSLMTGAARSATVRAVRHLVLAEIEKSAIAPLLAASPATVAVIAQEITRLETENDQRRDASAASAVEAETPADRFAVVSRLMRSFFLLGG